jgi:hypothetical protein
VARVRGQADGLIVAETFSRDRDVDPWFELIVLAPESPEKPLAHLEIGGTEPRWRGESELWANLPKLYTRSLGPRASWRRVLVLLENEPGRVRVEDIPQTPELKESERGLLAAIAPDKQTAVVGSIGGDALALIDLKDRRVLRTFHLPRSISSTTSRFRPGTSELWLACYGRLVRVDLSSGKVASLDVGSWRDDDDVADFAFTHDFRTCAVALYRSGAVLAVNTNMFDVTHKAETAESLDEIALLDDGRFVAKVWRAERFVVAPLEQDLSQLK